MSFKALKKGHYWSHDLNPCSVRFKTVQFSETFGLSQRKLFLFYKSGVTESACVLRFRYKFRRAGGPWFPIHLSNRPNFGLLRWIYCTSEQRAICPDVRISYWDEPQCFIASRALYMSSKTSHIMHSQQQECLLCTRIHEGKMIGCKNGFGRWRDCHSWHVAPTLFSKYFTSHKFTETIRPETLCKSWRNVRHYSVFKCIDADQSVCEILIRHVPYYLCSFNFQPLQHDKVLLSLSTESRTLIAS